METKPNDGTRSLAAAVHRHGLATPQALAVSSEGLSLTYRQLAGHAARLADRLAAAPEWNAGRGIEAAGEIPRVGILASRSAEACIAVNGVAWAGATYVPLGLRLPDERLLTILSLCNLAAIVTDEEGASRLNEPIVRAAPACVLALGRKPPAAALDGRVGWLETGSGTASGMEAPAADEYAPPSPMDHADPAYIIFTSGTTGTPKGVMIPLRAVRHFVDAMTRLLGLKASDRVLECCELTFDVSVHNMFTTWEAGASLHVLPATRTMSAVRFASLNGLTVWNSVPSLAAMLRQVKALGPVALPDLRLTIFGGGQLSRETVQAWQSAAPASTIWNFYGPTETTVYCLGQPIVSPVPLSPGRDVVAIGTPLPGCEAAVLDAEGSPVADGRPGELAIAGAQLAIGYLQAPEQTAARFPTVGGRRWYRTGDLAVRDDAGTFHWRGRLDNQVKVLGHRVELEEVDAHLRMVAHADLVGTVAWPLSEGAAQGMVAFVAGQRIDESGIIAALMQRLPPYMVPSRIVSLDSMPLNANGKVDRRALRQRLEQGAS